MRGCDLYAYLLLFKAPNVLYRQVQASGGSRFGARGHSPPNLAQHPNFRVITVHKLLNTGQLLDTAVLLVVASQMMRGHPPIFS